MTSNTLIGKRSNPAAETERPPRSPTAAGASEPHALAWPVLGPGTAACRGDSFSSWSGNFALWVGRDPSPVTTHRRPRNFRRETNK